MLVTQWKRTTLSLRNIKTIITVTSWWARWRLKSPTSRWLAQTFVQAQTKENIKAERHWPLWGAFAGDRWIPLTKGQPVTREMFPFDDVIVMMNGTISGSSFFFQMLHSSVLRSPNVANLCYLCSLPTHSRSYITAVRAEGADRPNQDELVPSVPSAASSIPPLPRHALPNDQRQTHPAGKPTASLLWKRPKRSHLRQQWVRRSAPKQKRARSPQPKGPHPKQPRYRPPKLIPVISILRKQKRLLHLQVLFLHTIPKSTFPRTMSNWKCLTTRSQGNRRRRGNLRIRRRRTRKCQTGGASGASDVTWAPWHLTTGKTTVWSAASSG